jgi:hypothetical protein
MSFSESQQSQQNKKILQDLEEKKRRMRSGGVYITIIINIINLVLLYFCFKDLILRQIHQCLVQQLAQFIYNN